MEISALECLMGHFLGGVSSSSLTSRFGTCEEETGVEVAGVRRDEEEDLEEDNAEVVLLGSHARALGSPWLQPGKWICGGGISKRGPRRRTYGSVHPDTPYHLSRPPGSFAAA
jgi:hypothetical protein